MDQININDHNSQAARFLREALEVWRKKQPYYSIQPFNPFNKVNVTLMANDIELPFTEVVEVIYARMHEHFERQVLVEARELVDRAQLEKLQETLSQVDETINAALHALWEQKQRGR